MTSSMTRKGRVRPIRFEVLESRRMLAQITRISAGIGQETYMDASKWDPFLATPIAANTAVFNDAGSAWNIQLDAPFLDFSTGGIEIWEGALSLDLNDSNLLLSNGALVGGVPAMNRDLLIGMNAAGGAGWMTLTNSASDLLHRLDAQMISMGNLFPGALTVDGNGTRINASSMILGGVNADGRVHASNGASVVVTTLLMGTWQDTEPTNNNNSFSLNGEGTMLTTTGANVGALAGGGTNTVNINDGARWDVGNGLLGLHIGDRQQGSVQVNDGTLENGFIAIGIRDGSIGRLDLTGSNSAATVRSVALGILEAGSTGYLTLDEDASVDISAELDIGINGGGIVEVRGGSSLSVGGDITLGKLYSDFNSLGDGTLKIEDEFSNVSASSIYVGVEGIGELIQDSGILSTSEYSAIGGNMAFEGKATLENAAYWDSAGPIAIAENGRGALSILTGSTVSSVGTSFVSIQPVNFLKPDLPVASAVATILVEGSGSNWTNTGEIKIGTADKGTQASIHVKDGGVISGTKITQIPGTDVTFKGNSTLQGVQVIEVNKGGAFVPGNGIGDIATLTLDTPDFDGDGGIALNVELDNTSNAQVSDLLYVTGTAAISGTLQASLLAGSITPWRAGSSVAGTAFTVLSSVGALTGTFDLTSLPSIGSLSLGSPASGYQFQWQVIYDRSNTPDAQLAAINTGTQSWVGNGTCDVVLAVVETPSDIAINSFYTSDGLTLKTDYTITATGNIAPFQIAIRSSTDGTDMTGVIQNYSITDSGDLSPGTHTVTFGAGSLTAPSIVTTMDDYLVAVVDSGNEIPETNEANNQALFGGGSFWDANGTTLHIQGTPSSDTVSATLSSGTLTVTTNSLTPFAYTASGVQTLNVHVHAGGDTVTANQASMPQHLYGGDDGDNLTSGDGEDYVWGGAGSDTIITNAGDDVAYGDSGDDYLYGYGGADELSGGEGSDTLTGDDDGSPYYGDDILIGDDGGDMLRGYGGNDTIDGGEGTDTAYGGDGDDTMAGGEGQDFLNGEAGNDTLYGGSHLNVTLHGSGDIDIIVGGDGNDIAYGGDGGDTINGDSGDDVLNGDAGGDTLYGDDDNDTITGGSSTDYIYGGNGNDQLHGGTGSDIIEGNDGADLIYGDFDWDSLTGGDGNDIMYGGIGDTAEAGILYYGDYLTGDAGDDILYGDDGPSSGTAGDDDSLSGGYGVDLMYGGYGNDGLYGGIGDDNLYGGEGDDTIHGDAGNNVLWGENGIDTIYGGEDNNLMYGGDGGDFLYGYNGSDIAYGGNGNDLLSGAGGTDYLYGDDGDDLLYGDQGSDYLYGLLGSDTLYGGWGADYLYGGDDDDSLFGEDDDDELYGEGGTDALNGGGQLGDLLVQ